MFRSYVRDDFVDANVRARERNTTFPTRHRVRAGLAVPIFVGAGLAPPGVNTTTTSPRKPPHTGAALPYLSFRRVRPSGRIKA